MEKTAYMSNVWKVGSRWSAEGNQKSTVLEIFRKHKLVFVGKNQARFRKISPGDLVTVSDGKRVVAMGLAIGAPTPITQIETCFSDNEKKRFSYTPNTLACQISFIDLPKDESPNYRIGAFHRVKDRADEFRKLYRQIRERFEEKNDFKIKARTCKLMADQEISATTHDALFQGKVTSVPTFPSQNHISSCIKLKNHQE